MKARGPFRLRVDPIACDGFGYCAELVPELIALDEWGYPVVAAEPVPAPLVGAAFEAVAACPRRALTAEAASPLGRPQRRRQAAMSSRRFPKGSST